MSSILDLIKGDTSSERVVPPTGFTATLTLVAAAAMAFLAVFVMSLAMTAGRQAENWQSALAETATVRISAPDGQREIQAEKVLEILSQTPGVGLTRRLTDADQEELLGPWFGAELPINELRLPVLIEVKLEGDGPDQTGLRQRFAAEAPSAVYDDHARWREPMVGAAESLRRLAWIAVTLIAAVTGVTAALAASSALAANGQVIDVLRLIGAEDSFITRAFVRRFTLRALVGATVGTILGLIAVAIIPNVSANSLTADIGFRGFGWIWPLLIPVFVAAIAFVATRYAAFRRLAEVS